MAQGELEKMRQLVSCLHKSEPTGCVVLPEELHAAHPSCIYPRDCYQEGLDYVIQKRGENMRHKIFRFGGTPGIGKTTFRYWILWLWVRGETNGLQQKHCLFSIGTSRLVLLTREQGDITVRGAGDPCDVYPAISPWSDDCVGVVEMSLPHQGIYKIPAEMCPCASLLLIVGSPGKFVKGVSCFKGVAIASPYYFPTWDADEAAKLPVTHFATDPSETVDEATIRRRCEEYGGVLRLMRSSSADAESQVNEALDCLNFATITVVVNSGQRGGETATVHRLLRLDAKGHVDGFISDRVARVAMVEHLNRQEEGEMMKFMQMAAKNPKGHTFWGYCFEERFGQGFSQQKMKLTFKTRSGTSEQLAASSSGLQHYQRGQRNLTKGVLYQPPACFQGIDFFMLADNETVYYLQATVSRTHSAVDPDHNDHTALDSAVKQQYVTDTSKQRMKTHIIYVVPDETSADTFTVPKIPDGWMCSIAWPEPSVLQTAGHGGMSRRSSVCSRAVHILNTGTKRSSPQAEGAPAPKRPRSGTDSAETPAKPSAKNGGSASNSSQQPTAVLKTAYTAGKAL